MSRVHPIRFVLTIAVAVALAPAVPAQWVEFVDETATRMSSSADLGVSDSQEKDYAWADVDKDGDVDMVVVRKEPFTGPGKGINVLFINEGGVLTDRTSDFVTAGSVSGDNGFLTPTNDRDVILVDLDLDGWVDMVTAVTISDGDPKHIGHPRIYMNLGCSPGGTSATSCTTNNWQGFYYDEPRIPTMLSWSGNSGHNPRFCSVSAGDLTGDDYPDLYFGDYDSVGEGGSEPPPGSDFNDKLLINAGVSNPGFFTDVTADPARFAGMVPGIEQSFEVAAFGAANAIRDMNNDLINDIVKQTALNPPQYVGIAYNNSTSTLGFFDTYDVVNQASPYFVSVGDLNNDNLLDLVITDQGADRYMLQEPNGGFVPDFLSYVFSFTGGASDDGFGGNSLIHDLDKDGWQDVLITDVDVDISGCSRRLHIYQNLGGTPGSTVTLREQTSGTGCQNFMGNPASCIVASIPSNLLEGVHDMALFDINGDTWTDMVLGRCDGTEVYMNVPQGVPAGAVQQDNASAQLMVGKSAVSGDIDLDWGASCMVGDTDYSVYEGHLLPPFIERTSALCSTAGATATSITPSSLSSYYLIVPHNGTVEGSYGSSSTGVPRPQAEVPCHVSNVGICE